MNEPVPQPGLRAADAFPTTVLLIRHGESAAVVPGTPESHDPPLSEVGRAQAAALAARLDGVHLDAVYASDLARAVDTARALAEPRRLEVGQRAELREVFLGEWEGGGFRSRAAARHPDFVAFATAGRWDLIPGCEGDDALRARVWAAIDELAAGHEGGRIAVVAHGGVINAWLARHWGTERSVLVDCDNTSVTTLRCGGGAYVVAGVNDRSHLGEAWT